MLQGPALDPDALTSLLHVHGPHTINDWQASGSVLITAINYNNANLNFKSLPVVVIIQVEYGH
jgi:hypothetical protein